MPSDVEVAWVAGLLEGEGSFGFTTGRAGGRRYPRIEMVSTDRDVVVRLAEVLGGRVNGPYHTKHVGFAASGNVKPQWRWRLNSQVAVIEVLKAIRPFMLSRRGARIDELLASPGAVVLVK
jgi:hypothetical protein